MWNRIIVSLTLPLIIGRVYATSGGGDEESGYYWWNDDTTFYFSGFNSDGNFYPESSYVFNSHKIPCLRRQGRIYGFGYYLGWDGPNPTTGPTTNGPLNGSCPEPFVSWIELSGWPDNPSSDSFYVGHLLAGDKDVVHNIDLKTGGKIPPEMSPPVEKHFRDFSWDKFYFFFAEKLYSNISISSDGWVAFNAGDINSSPSGKLPDPVYPNATLAPYWVDFSVEQKGFPDTPWKNPNWGAKACGHPWWDRKNWRWSSFWGDEYTYVHADSGVVLWGLRFYRLHLLTVDTTYVSHPDPTQSVMPVNVWIPVFVIEWCDVALASNPHYHYRFQVQLLNPVPDDSLWAYFVGRLARPGLKDTVAEPEVAEMYFFQNKVLIPQQILYLYHSRYNGVTGERVFDNSEPPSRWKSNDADIGLEDENGAKGISIDPDRLKDMYVVKFDYFKRYHNDLSITIVNPPFHRVLRWTELKPMVLIQNHGRNSVIGVPIDIKIYRAGTLVYRESADIPPLAGLGTDRWATPIQTPDARVEIEFSKGWIPEEIGSQYHIKAEIIWGWDENPLNNIYEKDVTVGCEDTLKYHTGNPTNALSETGVVLCSYIPYGGSQTGFSWVQALACYILQGWPDDCYQDFEMALVEDNIPGYGIAGHPNCFYYKYLTYGGDWWSTTIYPSLWMTGPHHGRSNDYDGWFDNNDAGIGPPNFTYMNKDMSRIWFNDTLYLGDSLAPGSWTREIAPDLNPERASPNSYPEKNEPDAWMVYWTGLHRATPSPREYGYCPPWYMDALMLEQGGVRVNTPYWDYRGGPRLFFNMTLGKQTSGYAYDDMKGPHGPFWYFYQVGSATAIPFTPLSFLLSPYPESLPVHPLLETYIKTGTYDACLYEIAKPIRWEKPAYEPGYYFEDHTSINFECKIANIGRVPLINNSEHRFKVSVQISNEDGEVVHSGFVGIDSLGVGDSLVRVKLPRWENTGEGGKRYNAIMWVNYADSGLHGADHCPYNDTMRFQFSVLWTSDVACSEVIKPGPGYLQPGKAMELVAEFRNLGYRDTTGIPVVVRIYNGDGESPPDSLLYEKREWIPDLNWKGSPEGPPIADTVEFGSFIVPPSTIDTTKSRIMRIEFRLAEDWKDEDPTNDIKTIYWHPGITQTDNLPRVFKLSKLLPNPVGSSVIIRYEVPFDSRVSIKVYDISGKLIRILVNKIIGAGYNKVIWDGRDTGGRRVPYGVYFVRMDAPNYKATKKLVILH